MPSVVLRAGLFASVAGAVAALDEFSGCSGASKASLRTFGGEHLTWLFGKFRRSCSKTCGDFPCIEKELDEIRSERAFKKMLKLVGGGPGGNPPVCTEFSGARFPAWTTDRNLFAPYFYKFSDECFFVSGKGKGRATPTCDARAEDYEGKGKGKGAYNRFCPCEVPCQKPCQYCQALCGSGGFNLTLGGGYLQCKHRCLQSFGELQLGFLDDYCERGRCRTEPEEEQTEVAGQPDDLKEEEVDDTHLLQYHRSIERDEPGGKDLSAESDLELEPEFEGRDSCRTRRQYCERLCRFELTDDSPQDCGRACRRNFKGFKTVFESYCTLGACGGKNYRKETHEEDEGEDTPLLQSADDEDNDGGEDEVEVGGEVTSLLQHAVRTSSPGGLEL